MIDTMLKQVLETLQEEKPKGASPAARQYATVILLVEMALAYYCQFVITRR